MNEIKFKREIIKFGSSLAATIPKEICENKNLQHHDPILISLENDKIIIEMKKEKGIAEQK